MIPSIFYGFRDGPFWGLLVRIGFDPRKDPESRMCVHSSLFTCIWKHQNLRKHFFVFFLDINVCGSATVNAKQGSLQ